VVNIRGLAFTSDVKMNSKRLELNFVITYSACVLPRRRDATVLIDRLEMVE
jgi:hypothetical protein